MQVINSAHTIKYVYHIWQRDPQSLLDSQGSFPIIDIH